MPLKLIRLAEVEGKVQPVASAGSFLAAYCSDPNCPHLHLVPCDENGTPYTMVVMTIEQLETLVHLAYELKAKKENGK